jgi:hypothetical protein
VCYNRGIGSNKFIFIYFLIKGMFLFKQLTTFLLSTLLVLGPLPSFARQYEVRGGNFPDGSTVQYLCEGKSSVKFLFTGPTGTKYQAELLCGDIA